MTRYELKNRISSLYNQHQTDLMHAFEEIDYVCFTVDVWGNKHRSFFGATAHYLDKKSLTRKSVALSCSRFPHPHSYDRIAEKIQLLYATFGLSSSKVPTTISDNARNFEKAFREFSNNFSEYDSYSKQVQANTSENDGLTFVDFDDMSLPNQVKCASHTLNLIGSNDITKAQSDKIYSQLYVSSFAKLNRLWNKTQYSKASEIIENTLESKLNRPFTTRWNAVPMSIKEVLSKNKDKLDELMIKFNIPVFLESERVFLQEYVDVLEPITSALNNLQKTNCHFGILLPTLFTAQRELSSFSTDRNIKFCKPLAQAALNGLNTRFSNLMDFESKQAIPALIATCTHPYFKLRWLRNMKTPENIEFIKGILLEAAKEVKKDTNVDSPSETIQENIRKDFRKITQIFILSKISITGHKKNAFVYDLDEENQSNEMISDQMEILTFLQQPCSNEINDFEQLDKFPLIREIFIKFNTPITSSGPVERLFSYAGKCIKLVKYVNHKS